MSWHCIVVTRDNGDTIRDCVISILGQTAPPESVAVIDDGSTDGTGEILDGMADERLQVHHTRNREPDYTRIESLLSMRWRSDTDYTLIMAGDCTLPPDYVSRIISRMDSSDTVVASGVWFDGQKAPSGAARMIKMSWWTQHYEKYPERIAAESEILFRATLTGYQSTVYPDIRFEHHDRLGGHHGFRRWGKRARALGYQWWFVAWWAAGLVLSRQAGLRSATDILSEYARYRPGTGYYAPWDDDLIRHIRHTYRRQLGKRLLGGR